MKLRIAMMILAAASLPALPQSSTKRRPPSPRPSPLPSKTVAETLGLDPGPTDLVAPTERTPDAPVEAAASTSAEASASTSSRPISRPIISGPTPPRRPLPAPSPSPTTSPAPVAPLTAGNESLRLNIEAANPAANPQGSGLVRVRMSNETRRFGDRIESPPRLSFGLSYIHSRWRDLSPRLKNGSLGVELGITREFSRGIEAGISAEILGMTTNLTDHEHVGGMTLKFRTRFFPWAEDWLRSFADFGLALGGYRVWSVLHEDPAQVTFEKISSGVLTGIQPGIGVRFAFDDFVTTDFRLGYHAYFDNPNFKVGGWNFGIVVDFQR